MTFLGWIGSLIRSASSINSPSDFAEERGPNLTSRKHSRNLTHNRLVAAQVSRAIEDKADVEPKVVALIVATEFGRKADNLTLPRVANNKAPT